MIVEDLVARLGLPVISHPCPYGWVSGNSEVKVTQQCNLRFAISSQFIDDVLVDVVPLGLHGIVLGSLYLFDKKVVFHQEENRYHLLKEGVKFIIRSNRSRTSPSLLVGVVQNKPKERVVKMPS